MQFSVTEIPGIMIGGAGSSADGGASSTICWTHFTLLGFSLDLNPDKERLRDVDGSSSTGETAESSKIPSDRAMGE